MTLPLAILAIWAFGVWLGYLWGQTVGLRKGREALSDYHGHVLAPLERLGTQRPAPPEPAPTVWWMDDNGARIRPEPTQ